MASVLVGARTPAQLGQVLGSTSLELTPEDLNLLGEVSAPGLPDYPYGVVRDWCEVDVWSRRGTAGPGVG